MSSNLSVKKKNHFFNEITKLYVIFRLDLFHKTFVSTMYHCYLILYAPSTFLLQASLESVHTRHMPVQCSVAQEVFYVFMQFVHSK